MTAPRSNIVFSYFALIANIYPLVTKFYEPPVMQLPLLDAPAIGRCCTGSMTVVLQGVDIGRYPPAASVVMLAQSRVPSTGQAVSTVSMGSYLIAKRRQLGRDRVELTCLDQMVKASQTYRDKTAIVDWPAPMTDVVDEIANLMGVPLDPQTQLQTGPAYVVEYPATEDMLMSEVLGHIAAAHGGNWIMSRDGKLRLVPLASPKPTADYDLGTAHMGFELLGSPQRITRVTLVDDAQNEFTAGDDTGVELVAPCAYATQAIANDLCRVPKDGAPGGSLYGVTNIPYRLSGAYLDLPVTLGDTVRVVNRDGVATNVVLQSLTHRLSRYFTSSAQFEVKGETENEFPWIPPRELALRRAVREDQVYFGNKINRTDGFVSELIVNDKVKARMIANAEKFSMQAADSSGAWQDRIYFDPVQGKYRITGEVEVIGAITLTDLSTPGKTKIDGANITTGTIAADRIAVKDLKVQKLYADSSDAVAVTSKSKALYIGGDGTVSNTFDTTYIYGASAVYIAEYKNWAANALKIDTANRVLTANSSYNWSLGTVGSGFGALYLGVGTSSCKLSALAGTLYINDKSVYNLTGTTIRLGGTSDTSCVEVSNDAAPTVSASSYDGTAHLGTSTSYWADLYAKKVFLASNCYLTAKAGGLQINDKPLTVSPDFTGETVKMGGDAGTFITVDTLANIYPKSYSAGTVGTSSHYWKGAYIKELRLSTTCTLTPATNGDLLVNGKSISAPSFVGKTLEMGNGTTNYILCNSSNELRPSTSSRSTAKLGTSTYYWPEAYIGEETVKIGKDAYSKLGFFTATPVARKTLSPGTANKNNVVNVVNNLIKLLKDYGLFT